MSWLLLGALAASLGLNIALVGGVLWLARSAIDHADKAADARERAAASSGEVALDARKVTDANAAVTTAAAAARTAEDRAGALEKELADDANRPPAATDLAGAADRLRIVKPEKPGGT